MNILGLINQLIGIKTLRLTGRKRSRNSRKMGRKSRNLASAAAGKERKKKKRERFSGSATGIKGRKEEGFMMIFLAFRSG